MMPSCLSILFRALRIEWRETKRTLFPTTPIETGLFLFFFLLDFFPAIFIFYSFTIISFLFYLIMLPV